SLVVIAAHEGAFTDAAHVVLPATSWADGTGTYVNKKGIRQISERALQPLGSSRPAWEHTRALARALGLEPSFFKLKDIRTALVGLAGGAASVKDVTASV